MALKLITFSTLCIQELQNTWLLPRKMMTPYYNHIAHLSSYVLYVQSVIWEMYSAGVTANDSVYHIAH